MKYFIAIYLLVVTGCSTSKENLTKEKAGTVPLDKVYPIAVSFGSICCGTVSEEFLLSFVKNFNSKNAVQITANIAAGCGKEGEFVILFPLSDLPENKRSLISTFTTELEETVVVQNAANKKMNGSSGSLNVLHNVNETEYLHCRLGIKRWL